MIKIWGGQKRKRRFGKVERENYTQPQFKKTKELREKGHSRQKTCEILNIPLVEEWSWYKYTNSNKVYDER